MNGRIKRRVTLSLSQEHWALLEEEAREQLRSIDDEVSVSMTRWAKARSFELNGRAEGAPKASRAARSTDARHVPDGEIIHLGEVLADTQTPRQWNELNALIEAKHVQVTTSESGFYGVYRNGKRWRAIVGGERGSGKERFTVATCDTPEEAAIARGRHLAALKRDEEEKLLEKERETGTILRSALTLHPAYTNWVWSRMTPLGVPKPPCPFVPGVRYTVDAKTGAVTRDADGEVIIPPTRSKASS